MNGLCYDSLWARLASCARLPYSPLDMFPCPRPTRAYSFFFLTLFSQRTADPLGKDLPLFSFVFSVVSKTAYLMVALHYSCNTIAFQISSPSYKSVGAWMYSGWCYIFHAGDASSFLQGCFSAFTVFSLAWHIKLSMAVCESNSLFKCDAVNIFLLNPMREHLEVALDWHITSTAAFRILWV